MLNSAGVEFVSGKRLPRTYLLTATASCTHISPDLRWTQD